MSEIKEIIEKKHPGKLFLSLQEACDLCGIKIGTVYNKRSKGGALPFKIRELTGRPKVAVSDLIRVAE